MSIVFLSTTTTTTAAALCAHRIKFGLSSSLSPSWISRNTTIPILLNRFSSSSGDGSNQETLDGPKKQQQTKKSSAFVNPKNSAPITRLEEKSEDKEARRIKFEEHQSRLERLNNRRKNRPNNGMMRKEFKAWYDERLIFQQKMDRTARKQKMDWKIQLAVVIERLPLRIPEPQPWQQEYFTLREHLDTFSEVYPKELKLEDEDEDVDAYFESEWPVESEADRTGDITTWKRRFTSRVYFAQQRTPTSLWEFPTVDMEEGVTFRDKALSVATQVLGSDAGIVALSPCPLAVDMEVKNENGYYGTKKFFMKLQFYMGDTNPNLDASSYGWLNREEFFERFMENGGPKRGKFYHYLL